MKECSQCNTISQDKASFCSVCGASLPENFNMLVETRWTPTIFDMQYAPEDINNRQLGASKLKKTKEVLSDLSFSRKIIENRGIFAVLTNKKESSTIEILKGDVFKSRILFKDKEKAEMMFEDLKTVIFSETTAEAIMDLLENLDLEEEFASIAVRLPLNGE